jgi:hypothetical protein
MNLLPPTYDKTINEQIIVDDLSLQEYDNFEYIKERQKKFKLEPLNKGISPCAIAASRIQNNIERQETKNFLSLVNSTNERWAPLTEMTSISEVYSRLYYIFTPQEAHQKFYDYFKLIIKSKRILFDIKIIIEFYNSCIIVDGLFIDYSSNLFFNCPPNYTQSSKDIVKKQSKKELLFDVILRVVQKFRPEMAEMFIAALGDKPNYNTIEEVLTQILVNK